MGQLPVGHCCVYLDCLQDCHRIYNPCAVKRYHINTTGILLQFLQQRCFDSLDQVPSGVAMTRGTGPKQYLKSSGRGIF